MSTWVVQVVVVALFALTCGALAAAWMRGRLGVAAIALFVGALAVWVVAFTAIAAELGDANGFATCDADCSTVHYVSAVAFLLPPLLIALSAVAMLVSRGSRWRLKRAQAQEGQGVVASSFKLPDLGEGLTEGEVARWLVAEGQEIAEDDPLVEIQTDKATVEIPSPYAGTVLKILVAEGEIAPVGTELIVIGQPGEAVPVDRFDDRSRLLASSRRSGCGRGGACRRRPSFVGSPRSSVSTSPRSPAPVPGGRITEDDVRASGAGAEGRREPLRGVRRVIAEHMARAHAAVPPVTWVEECDFEDVPLERLLPTVVKACADALVEFPELNARFDGDAILYLDRYDIGVAVQTDDGLVVPVVRRANEKSVDELGTEIAALAERARTGSLGAEDLRGSTFTVSSAGKLAGLFQTPIVNHPEVAILSIGRVAPRAVVRDGEIVVRRTGALAITFDHRVVDGARAAAFGLAVIAADRASLRPQEPDRAARPLRRRQPSPAR